MKKLLHLALLWVCSIAAVGPGRAQTPNLYVDVSADIFNAVAAKPVNEVSPIREWMMDACVYGTACTKGLSRIELVPDMKRATFDLIVTGQTTTKEKSFPVDAAIVVHTNALVHFGLRKRLVMDSEKLCGSYPTACARVFTFYKGVCSLTQEQQTAATDGTPEGFRQNKWESEQVAANLARTKMTASLERDTAPEIHKLNDSIANFSALLKRFGLTWQPWQWSTTSTHLTARLTFATPSQPATVSMPPLPTSDLSLRLHQSAFNEVAHKQLAGKTFTLAELAGLAPKLLGSYAGPDLASQIGQLDKLLQPLSDLGVLPSSLTFASTEPLKVQFQNGGVTTTLRLASFKIGSKDFPVTQVSVTYTLESSPKGPVAVRRGPVDVQMFGSDGTQTPDDLKNMAKALQEQIQLGLRERIQLPQLNLPQDAGTMQPEHAQAQGGWLALGWDLRR